VLDFSKINHFERTWRKSKRGTSRSVMSLRQSDIPIINLYADVDVSVICEEVVEGVYAGHIFQSGTAANFDMVAKVPTASVTLMGTPALPQQVILIFDVDFEDFHFTTQPGAFRRIVMNLLGNALKYTAQGYVRVKLTSTPMDDFHDVETGEIVPRAMLQLTVTDTGKGISPEFLRSRLFTPFTQENSLSSGTGLGLAIVKSIVSILEGDITIDSEVGRGTRKHFGTILQTLLTTDRGSCESPSPSRRYQTPRFSIHKHPKIDHIIYQGGGRCDCQTTISRCWAAGFATWI
jgi:signal transduction histidine kinase